MGTNRTERHCNINNVSAPVLTSKCQIRGGGSCNFWVAACFILSSTFALSHTQKISQFPHVKIEKYISSIHENYKNFMLSTWRQTFNMWQTVDFKFFNFGSKHSFTKQINSLSHFLPQGFCKVSTCWSWWRTEQRTDIIIRSFHNI